MAKDSKKEAKSEKEISFLNQLVIALEESEIKLEESYKKNKPEQFDIIRNFMLKLQSKISEEIK